MPIPMAHPAETRINPSLELNFSRFILYTPSVYITFNHYKMFLSPLQPRDFYIKIRKTYIIREYL